MKRLLTAEALASSLADLAQRIAGDAPGAVALIGIRRRGAILAERLRPLVTAQGVDAQHLGALDITLYRDDLTAIGPAAIVRGTEIDFPIDDAWIVLVDDVIYTGRSIRAALTALGDYGRAKAIKLAVLVDRGGRELPIQPDYCGHVVDAGPHEIVEVQLSDIDDAEGVVINDRTHR